jgi:hypothetical protein
LCLLQARLGVPALLCAASDHELHQWRQVRDKSSLSLCGLFNGFACCVKIRY